MTGIPAGSPMGMGGPPGPGGPMGMGNGGRPGNGNMPGGPMMSQSMQAGNMNMPQGIYNPFSICIQIIN